MSGLCRIQIIIIKSRTIRDVEEEKEHLPSASAWPQREFTVQNNYTGKEETSAGVEFTYSMQFLLLLHFLVPYI